MALAAVGRDLEHSHLERRRGGDEEGQGGKERRRRGEEERPRGKEVRRGGGEERWRGGEEGVNDKHYVPVCHS